MLDLYLTKREADQRDLQHYLRVDAHTTRKTAILDWLIRRVIFSNNIPSVHLVIYSTLREVREESLLISLNECLGLLNGLTIY